MLDRQLYKPNEEITPEQPKRIEKFQAGSHEKELLLRAMIDGYSPDTVKSTAAGRVTTHYTMDGSGTKMLHFDRVQAIEMQDFFKQFRENPKQACAVARTNLLTLARDETLSEEQRKDRLKRYLQAYLELIPKLDRFAFPSDGGSSVMEGVPSYIPDGLSDMGGDREVNPQARIREKIRVDKQRSYEVAFSQLFDALWALRDSSLDASSDAVKIFLAKYVMSSVFHAMPYDAKKFGLENRNRSVRIDELVTSPEPSSVCRHIAMETQIRLQALGLESRLLKCTLDDVAHVANILRVNGQWYLIDTTNPEADRENPPYGKPYARPITLSTEPNQVWELTRFTRDNSGTVDEVDVEYVSRNNMFYRVLDNEMSPAQ